MENVVAAKSSDQSQRLSSENLKHSLGQPTESPPQRLLKIVKVSGDDDDDEEEEEEEEERESERTMSQNPRIQRYLVAVEYIGTRFAGAQQQATGRTVVGVLEEAFRKFIGQSVCIFCSSRTDAGVHALSNVCHVDVERISKRKPGEVLPPHEPAVVKKAVNHFLKKDEGDITVIDVRCVPADFHARYKAQERTYFYRFLTGPESVSTFEKDRAWHVPEELDLLAMQKACRVLAGHHDFSSFRASACQAKSPIRSLDELSVTEIVPASYFPSVTVRDQNVVEGFNGEASQVLFGMRRSHRCFVVTARARSFLYHQVRLLVGTLKAVGTGDLTVPEVERILNAKTVTAASPMAPARGLYLAHVKYDLP